MVVLVNTDEFYIESKRVLAVTDILVNCFKIEEDKLLFVMKKSIIVTSGLLISLNKV